jgi:lysophospholipase L1-like esterase
MKSGYKQEILFSFIIMFVLLSAVEMICRDLHLGRKHYSEKVPDKKGSNDPAFVQLASFARYRLHQNSSGIYIGRAGVEFHYSLNSHGMNEREFVVPKPAGRFRVFCLGDSCTFGEGLGPNQLPYPQRIDRALQADPQTAGIEVLNAGIPGYTSDDGLGWFRSEILNFGPDLVTVLYGWNDHWIEYAPQSPKKKVSPALVSFNRLLDKSAFFSLFRNFLYSLQKPSSRQQLQQELGLLTYTVPIGEYEKRLESFAQLARDHRIKLLFITAPSALKKGEIPLWMLESVYNLDTVIALHEAYNDVCRKVAARNQVPLLDLAKIFAGQDLNRLFDNYRLDPIHFNAAGHEFVADQLRVEIEKIYKKFSEHSL